MGRDEGELLEQGRGGGLVRGLRPQPAVVDEPPGELERDLLRAVVHAAAPLHVRSVRRRFLDALDAEQRARFTEIAQTVVAALGPPALPSDD